jgi:hypothetical protein
VLFGHVARHALDPQAYAPQGVVIAAGQEPAEQ